MGPVSGHVGARVATACSTGRRALRGMVVSQLGGELDAAHIAAATDDGWFGPQSVAWKIHSDACLLIGGIEALLRQTLHPLAMAGVADHSNYETDPWDRLHRTSSFLADVVYGGSVEAHQCIERVLRIHSRIAGTAPDGRMYRADDPELLRYVHATEVDGFLRSYQRYGGGRISDREADQYVAEMARVATALGATDVPESVDDLRGYLEAVRPALQYGDQAQRAVQFLRRPIGGSVQLTVGYRVILDGACALLPEHEASMLNMSQERRRGALLRSGVAASCALRWVLGESPVVVAARERAGGS